MPTKRKPVQRQRHPSSFNRETLELFIELEHAPRQRRRTEAYRSKEKSLMYGLGLVSEFWTVCSVLDTSLEPNCGPDMARYNDWFRTRAVREKLLAAAGIADAPTSAQ
jgi:hypothetical protein